MTHGGELFANREQDELKRIWEWSQRTHDGTLLPAKRCTDLVFERLREGAAHADELPHEHVGHVVTRGAHGEIVG